MSSESSDDIMSCGVCSQDSNANVAPSSGENTPISQFASLCLIDHGNLRRWRPLEESDYDIIYDAPNGKRKQGSQESETDVQQKKLKKDKEMECQETDSECQLLSEKSDAYEVCEADNEEEELKSVEESGEECDGACCQEPDFFHMDDEPISELPLNQPSTLGMKRKSVDKLECPTVPKVKRSS